MPGELSTAANLARVDIVAFADPRGFQAVGNTAKQRAQVSVQWLDEIGPARAVV